MLVEGIVLSVIAGGLIGVLDNCYNGKSEEISEEKKEIVNIQRKWRNSLLDSNTQGIKNGNGQTFELHYIKPTTFGYMAKTKLPSGVSFESLKSAIPTLEGNFDATISVEKDKYNSEIKVEIITKKPIYDFKSIKTVEDKPFLAYLPNGKPYFTDLNYEPHVVWCGKSRTGKSTAMYITLVNHLANCKNFDLYIAQIVNGETDIFSDCKNVRMIAKSLDETEILLKKLNNIAEQRTKVLSESGSLNIGHYNKKYPKNKLKRIILVMEEFSFFVPITGENETIKKQKQRCDEIFLRIAKAGAYCGIHLFGVVQRMTHSSINPTIRGQVSVLSFAQKDAQDSKYAIDRADASDLGWRECIYSSSGDYKFLIAPTVNEELQDLKEIVPELRITTSSDIEDKPINKTIYDSKLSYEETQELKNRAKTEHMEVKNVEDIYKATGSLIGVSKGKYDKDIIDYIAEYGAISVKQCWKIFMKDNKEGNEQARSRLHKLKESKVLNSYKNPRNNETVYYVDKEISSHDLMIRDFYAELIFNGAKVLEFDKHPIYLNGMIKPDAYIKYKLNGKIYHTMLEVDYKHPAEEDKSILYEKLYEELNVNFDILVMSIKGKTKLKSQKIEINTTDFKLSNFSEIF